MTVVQDADGNTTLEARIIDQAALYGPIDLDRGLGLTLLMVQRVATDG